MCSLLMPALSINAVRRWGVRPVQLGRQNVKKVACKRRSNSRRVAASAKLFHTGVNANEQMLQRNSITCSISIRGRGRGGGGGEAAVFAFAGSVSNPGKSKRNELIKRCW